MTNPIPKRAMKAAVIAAFLSGKVMGSMIPTSIAPNARPQIAPRTTLDMFASSNLLNSPRNNLHHVGRSNRWLVKHRGNTHRPLILANKKRKVARTPSMRMPVDVKYVLILS